MADGFPRLFVKRRLIRVFIFMIIDNQGQDWTAILHPWRLRRRKPCNSDAFVTKLFTTSTIQHARGSVKC